MAAIKKGSPEEAAAQLAAKKAYAVAKAPQAKTLVVKKQQDAILEGFAGFSQMNKALQSINKQEKK